MSARLRVIVADDHAPTVEDVRAALEADPSIEVCATAVDAAGAISAALAHRPDVCVLDISMPGNGLAAAWEISARLPETAVVMLTVSTSDGDLLAALRAGAAGYLLKDMDSSRLPHALRGVVQGEAALPRALVARLIAQFRDRAPSWRLPAGERPHARLTSREWQVLELMQEELTTSQIARRLMLAPATVRSHRSHILRKLRAEEGGERTRVAR
ncbi:MAG TPA: response regulator transcription factor [Gaiellaceae bacterium]